MRMLDLKANYFQTPKEWTQVEIAFLIKYYPLYKQGSTKWTASTLRGNLQSRTMSAISKKYWSIMGSTITPNEDINQNKFDFAQEKLV